jgi:phytanoyl-CoA hydroxylase
MMTTATLPAPKDSRETARPFSSWPTQGRPNGWFRAPLGPDAARFYEENGFLVLENALNLEEVAEMNAETLRICRGQAGAIQGAQEMGAGESDEEVLRRYLCIHFPDRISETMTKYLGHPSMVDVLTRVIGPDVKCMQSMLFVKAAGKPGQAWHQDELYIPTRDRSLCGGWIAMDDATVENGCLWVIPGSHKPGILWPQHDHGDRRFDCAWESVQFPYTAADEVPVEVKAGSIVFFNGYLLHRSFPNRAQSGYRRVLVNHYMSAQSLLPWYHTDQKVPIGTADARDIRMIAGQDPYAYKGTCSNHTAFLRPSGEGGCGTKAVEKAEATPAKG